MERYGFFHDTARCVDCKACQVACKEKNKLSAGEYCRRAETLCIAEDGATTYVRFSGACNHCAEPACVDVCPTGAMYISADGTVQHKDALCIGCGRCVHHCPYSAVSLNKYTGYAQKCDACMDRREMGRLPVCVEACPMEALHFGPISALQREYGENLGANVSYLPPAQRTKPSLLVRGGSNGCTPSSFTPTTEEATPPVEAQPSRVVILGSGPAALAAAFELRRRSAQTEITVISRERRLPYSRPMLSKALTASFASDRYDLFENDRLEKERIQLLGGVEITALNCADHSVTLADGRTIFYDKCIYALGAECFLPPIAGNTLPGVYTLRSEGDIAAIRREMLTAKRAVIVGGGITGTELAWELKKSGLDVTLVEPLAQLMERFLDKRSADRLFSALCIAGIEVCLGSGVLRIEGEKHAAGIVLESGERIAADLVILSAGYRPNIALAKAAGLHAEYALHVTEYAQTSDADIYACGDCTDLGGATWVQSIRQGRLAAANVLGAAEKFAAETEPVMVHSADTSMLSLGDLGKNKDKKYRFFYAETSVDDTLFRVNPLTQARKSTHFSFCCAEGTVVGAAMVGNLSAMKLVEAAVNENWKTEQLMESFSQRGVQLYEA